MSSRSWKPPKIITTEYPLRCIGYDGKVHLERATPSQWRALRMAQARARGTHTLEEWENKKKEIGKCAKCGATDVYLTKDHIIPITNYGCDCIRNLQPLCSPCNSVKGNRVVWAE